MKKLLSGTFVRYQLPAILVALAIFVLSSIPDLRIPSLHWKFKDKWAHLIAYTVLGFLTCRALYYQSKYYALQIHPLIWAFLLVTIYGISDEIHQAFVPGRRGDFGISNVQKVEKKQKTFQGRKSSRNFFNLIIIVEILWVKYYFSRLLFSGCCCCLLMFTSGSPEFKIINIGVLEV